MASADFKKGSEEYMMFMDFWNLCKRLWKPENREEYWQEVVTETGKFNEKYHTPYSKHLALGIVNALDEVSKGGDKNAEKHI